MCGVIKYEIKNRKWVWKDPYRHCSIMSLSLAYHSLILYYFYLEECRSQLGMEFSKIPDHRITASSSYEVKSVGPQNAR